MRLPEPAHALIWAGLLLLLSACSLVAPIRPDPALPVQTLSPDHWSLRGRISVVHGDDSWSGSLRWQHHPDGDELTIRDPVGRTRLRASSWPLLDSDRAATLQIAGEAPITGRDFQSILESITHLSVPFQQLTDWVTGRANADTRAEITNDPDSGRVAKIEQTGWVIDYPEYRLEETLFLPRKITLHNDDTRIRLVITRWQLLPARKR